MADAPPPGFKEIAVPEGFKEVAAKAPVERGEGDKTTSPTTPEGIQSGIFRGGERTTDPVSQFVDKLGLPAAAVTGAAGELAAAARLAPAVGRVAAGAGIGAARSASKGENPLWGGFIDALVGAGTEGLMALLPGMAKIPGVTRSVGEMAGKVRSTRAGEASVAPRIDKAIELIKDRLPKGAWLNVPALSAKRMTLEEAAAALKNPKLVDEQFQLARAQLVHQLNEADRTLLKQGVKPLTKPFSGSIFGQFAPKEHFRYRPTGAEKMAAGIVKGTESPALRSLADVATTEDVGGPSGVLPVGAAAVLGAPGSLRGMAGRWLR